MRLVLSLIVTLSFFSCAKEKNLSAQRAQETASNPIKPTNTQAYKVRNGDLRLSEYLPILKNKKIALVVNQSSILGQTHLIDTLLSYEIDIHKIFAPEHGIRGNADAGEKVNDGIDAKTGIPIISLYGSHKKPFASDLEGIEMVVFDLQDVGVRFYTYISTMHYVMEACAENNIPLMILDRPNPNGDYVAGPVLEEKYKSFVGMHPIPIVHGLTVGELALMINGESWLANDIKVDLRIIECKNYTHDSIIPLAIKPSPNLPTLNAIRWYPSICLFEETQVSVGRGTYFPFETFGSPYLDSAQFAFNFTPESIDGMSKNPPFLNQKCFGEDLRQTLNTGVFRYDLLANVYHAYKGTKPFFTNKNFTYKLCGTTRMVDALEDGKNAIEIASLFENELNEYKKLRAKYLLYPDFNEK